MAGSTSSSDDSQLITAINVTPLVDIVLVLLIILMVTASYIISQSIPMELPNADPAEQDSSPPEMITVSIDAEGTLFVDQAEASWEELSERARAFAHGRSDPRAVIAADRSVSHGEFIRIVDLLRQAGIVRYAINVSPAEDSASH